ncbi:MAG: hypothetical protein ACTSXH_09610 [Promethearchaeota archaeon]
MEEHPEVQIGNASADNAYSSDAISKLLDQHDITNSIAPVKRVPTKFLKKGKIKENVSKEFWGSWSNV